MYLSSCMIIRTRSPHIAVNIKFRQKICSEQSLHSAFHVVHMGVSKVTLLVSHEIATQKKWAHDTDGLVASLRSQSTSLSPCWPAALLICSSIIYKNQPFTQTKFQCKFYGSYRINFAWWLQHENYIWRLLSMQFCDVWIMDYAYLSR